MPGAEGNPGKTVTTKKTIISRIDTQQNKRYAKTKEILLLRNDRRISSRRTKIKSSKYVLLCSNYASSVFCHHNVIVGIQIVFVL